MGSLRTVGITAALVALAAAATALAVSPGKKTKFTGAGTGSLTIISTVYYNDPMSFLTSKTGKQVLKFTFKDKACSGFGHPTVHLPSMKVSGGKFSISHHKTKEGKTATVTNVKGKFVSATKATGTFNYAETIPGGECGPIHLHFTAMSAAPTT